MSTAMVYRAPSPALSPGSSTPGASSLTPVGGYTANAEALARTSDGSGGNLTSSGARPTRASQPLCTARSSVRRPVARMQPG